MDACPSATLVTTWFSMARYGVDSEDLWMPFDRVRWVRDGRVCIDFRDGEHAIARPCVLKDGDRYRMWYCFRGPSYRIGYAESADGLEWTRFDERAGIDVSSAGWDSEMLAYPFVFDSRGARYMLYNGNGYGRSGVGWAVLESD